MIKILKDKYVILSVVVFIYFIAISNFQNLYLSLLAILMCLPLMNYPQYLIPHVLLTSLFGDYFVALPGIGMSRIIGIIFVISVFILGYKKDRACYIEKNLFLSAGILSVLSLASCMSSITGIMIPAYVLILNFLIMLALSMLSYEELMEGFFVLRVNTIIMALNIIFSIVSGSAAYFANRLIFHYSLNSNGLGMAVVQLAVIIIALMYFKDIQQSNLINILIVGGCIFIIMLTGSRTSLIAILGAITVLFVYYGFFNKDNRIKIQYILIPVVLIWLVLYALNHIELEMFTRFTAESVLETGGSGREEIWKCALENVFPNYPIWGVGLGVENTIAALSGYGLPNNVGIHNMYITLLIQVGIVGAVVFLFIICKYTINALRYIRFTNTMFLPALMLVSAWINGIGEEVYAERFVWMAIGMVYVLQKEFMSVENKKMLKENGQ